MGILNITALFNNRDTIAAVIDAALAQIHPVVGLIVIEAGQCMASWQ